MMNHGQRAFWKLVETSPKKSPGDPSDSTGFSETYLEATRLEDDPIAHLLLTGQAQTFEDAEETYLDGHLPEIYRLLGGPLSNEELAVHPLIRMLYFHGSRGWEDSL